MTMSFSLLYAMLCGPLLAISAVVPVLAAMLFTCTTKGSKKKKAEVKPSKKAILKKPKPGPPSTTSAPEKPIVVQVANQPMVVAASEPMMVPASADPVPQPPEMPVANHTTEKPKTIKDSIPLPKTPQPVLYSSETTGKSPSVESIVNLPRTSTEATCKERSDTSMDCVTPERRTLTTRTPTYAEEGVTQDCTRRSIDEATATDNRSMKTMLSECEFVERPYHVVGNCDDYLETEDFRDYLERNLRSDSSLEFTAEESTDSSAQSPVLCGNFRIYLANRIGSQVDE